MTQQAPEIIREETQHQLDLATQPTKRLRQMLKAGEEVKHIWEVLDRTSDNVVGEILRHQGTFFEWDHYPKGDAYDRDTHSQYFYHAHPSPMRDTEHGHFHTFIRRKGMPKSMRPAKNMDRSLWPTGDDALAHIVGISMDQKGFPLRMFTTNRWVTGETWYKAPDIIKLIGRYEMTHAQPSWPTNRWISAMIRMFWPQVIVLLKARDQAVAAWAAKYPDADPLEDRRLEIAAQTEISVDGQIAALRAALDSKS